MNAMKIPVATLRDNCAKKFADTHHPRTFEWRVIPHDQNHTAKPRIVPVSLPTKARS